MKYLKLRKYRAEKYTFPVFIFTLFIYGLANFINWYYFGSKLKRHTVGLLGSFLISLFLVLFYLPILIKTIIKKNKTSSPLFKKK